MSHFTVKVRDQVLTLEVVGFEIEGKYFWVYQEIEQPLNVAVLSVRMTALQEVWPTHINHVNVQREQGVRSVRLSVNDGFKGIKLER